MLQQDLLLLDGEKVGEVEQALDREDLGVRRKDVTAGVVAITSGHGAGGVDRKEQPRLECDRRNRRAQIK